MASADSYSIVVFIKRKATLSPSEFMHHWENVHVPLLKRLGGSRFPLSHTRHYIGPTLHPAPAQDSLTEAGRFDAFAIITFNSETAFHDFVPVMSLPEVLRDEENFTEPERMKAETLVAIRSAGAGGGTGELTSPGY